MVNELFVVGGPQGRFIVEDVDNETKVTNQLDRYIEKTMEKKIGQKKEFSKKSNEFIAQAKLKTKNIKK